MSMRSGGMSLGQSMQWGCGYAAMRIEPCAWSVAAVTVAYLPKVPLPQTGL